MKDAMFGIVGLETSAALTYTELVDKGILTPMQMAEKMSYNPAKILGIADEKGSVSEGMVADIVIFDPKREYRIDKNTFFSKGKNTPFDNYEVKGDVRYTFVGGKMVYENTAYEEEENMINKLVENIKRTKAPIVVGLDPMLNYIPQHIQKKAFAEFGETLEGAGEAIWQFNKEIIDKTYDLIPAVKPQIAMYEQFGIPGLVAFKKTVDYCKEKGLVVIGDIKRGDIGSTSSAYAVGHLGHVQVGSKSYVPFDEDFATVNPYLGSDGINPFIDVCKEENKGLFILVKTSNPSSGEFQDRLVDGRPLYELVGEKVAQWGENHMGDEYSYIGAVVGATYPEMGKVLRKVMPKSYILVPGYGAQGGQGKDLVHFFNEDGLGAIVNSSRGIIAAYKQEAYAEFGEENFADASREAVETMIADINGALENR